MRLFRSWWYAGMDWQQQCAVQRDERLHGIDNAKAPLSIARSQFRALRDLYVYVLYPDRIFRCEYGYGGQQGWGLLVGSTSHWPIKLRRRWYQCKIDLCYVIDVPLLSFFAFGLNFSGEYTVAILCFCVDDNHSTGNLEFIALFALVWLLPWKPCTIDRLLTDDFLIYFCWLVVDKQHRGWNQMAGQQDKRLVLVIILLHSLLFLCALGAFLL